MFRTSLPMILAGVLFSALPGAFDFLHWPQLFPPATPRRTKSVTLYDHNRHIWL